MKKSVLAMLMAMTLVGCGGKGFTLSGVAPEGVVEMSYGQVVGEDETQVVAQVAEDGTFSFKGKVEMPTLVEILADGEIVSLCFLEEGELTFSENELGGYLITGSASNDAMNKLNSEMAILQARFLEAQSVEEQEALFVEADSLTRASIEDNLDNLFGLFVLAQNFGLFERQEVEDYMARVSPELSESGVAKLIRETLDKRAKTETGEPFIELNLNDVNGQAVALSSLVGEGKWVLVDFWATWCGPCKAEIPYLVEAYKALHEKGFEIYGVSLDHDPEAWKAYVADHEMTWVNVLGRDGKEAQAQVDNYSVESIPSNFLISPEGKIVAKQLRGEAVMTTLQEFIQ